ASQRIAVDTTSDVYVLFVYPSRRRHTRSNRDWSSDVCSSDPSATDPTPPPADGRVEFDFGGGVGSVAELVLEALDAHRIEFPAEIGRASCREKLKTWCNVIER